MDKYVLLQSNVLRHAKHLRTSAPCPGSKNGHQWWLEAHSTRRHQARSFRQRNSFSWAVSTLTSASWLVLYFGSCGLTLGLQVQHSLAFYTARRATEPNYS
eukprot:gnl/TRDRNA2_/TRDRNA2_217338_c0_seq1.p2 gnl/TRDRNA2_/TRDRNA2_217338_c0~~gnl/TRDRNA2_/TRDRNA2_217338_c0_seq1.p2  ORF type:complete len:115 (-),score=0.94 gnl/TRDRNA2_/TRDRNA2_217338_c0_seq1:25-327(-)